MPKVDDLHKAASALEAYFLRRVLGEVRTSEQGMANGGFAGGMFKEMFDEAVADAMASAGGVGMAAVIERQLSPGADKADKKTAPAPASASAPAPAPAPAPRTTSVPEPLSSPPPQPIEGGSVTLRRYQAGASSFPSAGRPTDRR